MKKMNEKKKPFGKSPIARLLRPVVESFCRTFRIYPSRANPSRPSTSLRAVSDSRTARVSKR